MRPATNSRHRSGRKKTQRRPFERLLHFSEGEVWSYRVGGSEVLIKTPDLRTTHRVDIAEISGLTPDEQERGIWKRWWTGIGPGQIKTYIEGHLRGSEAMSLPPIIVLMVNEWWKSDRWHIYMDCQLAYRRGHLFTPSEAEQRLGAPLTRRNLCGPCRSRRERG